MSGGTLNQPYVFMAAIYGGLICGALYCALRQLRRRLGAGRILSGAVDGVFTLLSTGVCLYILYETTLFEVRIYHFVGIGVGFVLFLLGVYPLITALVCKIRGAKIDKTGKTSDNE